MSRVLFVNTGAEGHTNPTLGIVQELVRRGEEVVYFTSANDDRMEAMGASVRTFDGNKFLKAFLEGGRSGLLSRVNGLLRTADIVIPSVLEQTKDERFDYMIHDSMFGCGRLLAQILNLPTINSCTSFVLKQTIFNKMLDEFAHHAPAALNDRLNQNFQQLVHSVQRKYHVKIDSPYEVFCNPAPLTLVYTTRDFQPEGDSFDESYKFIGPSITPRSSNQNEFSNLKTDSLIYISLGTVINQAMDFYRLCFATFANTKHTVILSVGSQTQIGELGDIPENFIVRHYVPQLEVLQHANLFITHGGMNSTSEGLYYGVPLIVFPQSADQPIIAQRVAHLGAGVQLKQDGLTPDIFREEAERILEDSAIHEVCKKIGDSFRAAGGYQRAVDEIFAYKRRIGLNH
ncbi:glycosyltransferase, MGT family [Seinonella peptonophila]|uniref:Glycosyltransferase, MGT family n=1 Tax=Seinonella peptonophila TaxID=112248 RepID=A0A1M4X5F7_9BACL|nr:macrolide family glycosyltransferase [Seinonella peptonophila]SHE88706.1 glycosyltransferase, MGT family [Seinonella peptonophila]